MPSCQVCTAEIRYDYDRPSKGRPYTIIDVSREAPHDAFCKPRPNPIPTIEMFGDIPCDRKPESLALAITNEAVRCGLDPFKVKLEHRGNWIILH